MDDTLIATPDPDPTPPKQAMGFSRVRADDGSYWIMITHQAGAMSFTWGVPLDGADELADGIAANIKQLAAESRRERSGLIVAPFTAGVRDDSNPVYRKFHEAQRRNGRRA